MGTHQNCSLKWIWVFFSLIWIDMTQFLPIFVFDLMLGLWVGFVVSDLG